MTMGEARRLANVNERSQRLFEDGYRARRLPRLLRGADGRYPGDVDLVEVTSPEGEVYEVSLPVGILERAGHICQDFLPSGKMDGVLNCPWDSDGDWLDLSAELTARQDEFNLLSIGHCTCRFWWQHSGRFWCKHYLGAPLLLAQERVAWAQARLSEAARVVAAMKVGKPMRLCQTKTKEGQNCESDIR